METEVSLQRKARSIAVRFICGTLLVNGSSVQSFRMIDALCGSNVDRITRTDFIKLSGRDSVRPLSRAGIGSKRTDQSALGAPAQPRAARLIGFPPVWRQSRLSTYTTTERETHCLLCNSPSKVAAA